MNAIGTLVYVLLALTSLVGLTFIVERAWALRWNRVAPRQIADALDRDEDVEALRTACLNKPSPLGRLLLMASDHLDWSKMDNVEALQTAARHEIVRLERGLVILEIIVGIAPLLGLVGTIAGMMDVFGEVGQTGLGDAAHLASGIAFILRTTLFGLLIAIPALVAWSYYTKKVEVLAAEMEALCDAFIRRQYVGQSR
jgi:biopolymer transport protein ExbB